MEMLKCEKEEYVNYSFKLAAGLFCNCGIPYTNRFRNLPCYHIFCQTCINKEGHQNKCQLCDSHVDKTEELHPNEDVFICTVPKCNQGFLNFSSLKVHSKLSHSLNVETVEEFYQKFGDVEVLLSQNNLLDLENDEFSTKGVKRKQDKCVSIEFEKNDNTSTKSFKYNKKGFNSSEKDEKLEILM